MAYYFDMDGVLSNFHKEKYSYSNAINRNWIANLEPFMDNVNLVRNLINAHEDVYILSKAASEDAKLGKIDWLNHYIPEMTIDHIIVIVGSATEGILIDDDIKNCRQWEKAWYEYYLVEEKGSKVIL